MADNTIEIARGDILASKYEVIDLLDESPLGHTYRVKHLKSGKFIRLTMMRPSVASTDNKDRLISAFKRAKSAQHGNIVKFGELGEHDGTAYFTFEDFDSRTLREVLQEYKIAGKQLELKNAAQIINAILEGLSKLHEEGITYRALRPEHVLVNVRYTGPKQQNFVAQVKLTSSALWDLVPHASLVEDEFARGSAQYLAPELKGFEPNASARCDVYSVGVIFYEMLTGSAPVGTFQQPTQLRDDLLRHVDDIVELALANAPEDRYRTARDLINDVTRLFDHSTVHDDISRPALGPVGYIAGATLVLAIGAMLFTVFSSDPEAAGKYEDQQVRAEIKEAHDADKPSDEERARIQGNHPKGMIYVPPGIYLSGRLNDDAYAGGAEDTHRRVNMPGYLIDAFEYPNEQGAQPLGGVNLLEAEFKCADQGKRLCTAQEWEKACKGPGSRVYAYGDLYDPEVCGEGLKDRGYASGSKAQCVSSWGVFDLSGGFAEWTSSTPGSDTMRRVVKGGNLASPQKGTRCAYGTDENVAFRGKIMSFRCCRDERAPPFTPAVDTDAAEGGE